MRVVLSTTFLWSDGVATIEKKMSIRSLNEEWFANIVRKEEDIYPHKRIIGVMLTQDNEDGTVSILANWLDGLSWVAKV